MRNFWLLLMGLFLLASCSKKNENLSDATESSDSLVVDNSAAEEQQKLFLAGTTENVLAITEKSDDTLRVVNFFATWCKPCIMEMPFLKSLPERISDKKFSLHFVSVDEPAAADAALPQFISEQGISNVIHWGNADEEQVVRVFEGYQGYIPFTLIKKGTKEEWVVGSIQNEEEFLKKLKGF